ncbi:hypothetical protein EJV46_11095 [Roseococcus sp. SYP-B2431]|uniref:hypothetical protein n=1 Tax=Roseococcus sp. SYP-B2431 TaxID=2496640 RepID=UPI00103D2697|nr:hypothetical protein [Roseococcus sp. SYP-B2431]TCH99074.1 hypothetical protein EJV46_11095 [Roseococcus sp. SYP-B2431]
MARSVIFLSTPTSASESMFRWLAAIAAQSYRTDRWVDRLLREGRLRDVATEFPPAQDRLVLHRAPQLFNPRTSLSDYRFVLNARDPRDLVCNQYHWQFEHPVPSETSEQTEARRARVAAAGIDHFALAQGNEAYLRRFFEVTRKIAPPDRLFVGYAMFCLGFDTVVERACAFFGLRPEEMTEDQRRRIELERVSNLAANEEWIGHRWAGTDTAPGRHRRELQPETIRILTERHRWFLDFLRRMDDPRVAETYS